MSGGAEGLATFTLRGGTLLSHMQQAEMQVVSFGQRKLANRHLSAQFLTEMLKVLLSVQTRHPL